MPLQRTKGTKVFLLSPITKGQSKSCPCFSITRRAHILLIKLHSRTRVSLIAALYAQFAVSRRSSLSFLEQGLNYELHLNRGVVWEHFCLRDLKWGKGDKPCSAESHSPTIHRWAESHESVGDAVCWIGEMNGMVHHRWHDSTRGYKQCYKRMHKQTYTYSTRSPVVKSDVHRYPIYATLSL